MNPAFHRPARPLFVSLKLTIFLLVLSIVLVFWATLAQTDLGVWGRAAEVLSQRVSCMARIPGTELARADFPRRILYRRLLLMINIGCGADLPLSLHLEEVRHLG